MTPGPEPFSTDYEEAPAYWQIGILWNVLISAEQTNGAFTMMDQTMPEGSGPPPHEHERMSEGFYILEGEIEYLVGDDDRKVIGKPSTAVWIPPTTKHSFKVTTPTSRALNFYSPGGFDDMFKYLATPAPQREMPPADFEDDVSDEKKGKYLKRLRDLHQETFLDSDKAVW